MNFYENVFEDVNAQTIKKLLSILLNTSEYILLSNNFSIMEGNSNISTFPSFFEPIQKTVFNKTSKAFNNCLVSRNASIFDLIDGKTEVCVLFFGNVLKFTSNEDPKLQNNSMCLYKKTQTHIFNSDPKTDFVLIFLNLQEKPLKNLKEYCNYNYRLNTCTRLRNCLSDIHFKFQSVLKFEEISSLIRMNNMLGNGDWGNVFSATINSEKEKEKFAVKLSRIKPEDVSDMYSKNTSSWYETNILKNILNIALEKKWCQNIPYLIESFVCPEFKLNLKKGQEVHPCAVLITELASGDLKDWFLDSTPIRDYELYSALFQIMAGIHCIQMSGQIVNNDIKSKNILYFNIASGGYWEYKIQDVNFYVPNYGKMFVINDFGVSHIYSPNHVMLPNKKRKSFNLGSRYALNINERFSPLNAENAEESIEWTEDDKIVSVSKHGTFICKEDAFLTSKIQFTSTQKEFLISNKYSTDTKKKEFYNPYVLPPFEFFNDTQDALRMFTGGKRTVQRGSHFSCKKISDDVKKSINRFSSTLENSKTLKYSLETHHVLAGSFILKFFSECVDFTKKIHGKKIDRFSMKKF